MCHGSHGGEAGSPIRSRSDQDPAYAPLAGSGFSYCSFIDGDGGFRFSLVGPFEHPQPSGDDTAVRQGRNKVVIRDT
ncbi:hypothetical protein BC826DRAFT_149038 [Russula brevipes]|nr:hypothetical protein BC826DRAFT_149038 [Russula brevipes]